MIKLIAQFESIIESKLCRVHMDHDTPIAVAKEFALAFLKHLGNVEDQYKAQLAEQEKAKAEAEKPIEEVAVESPQSE